MVGHIQNMLGDCWICWFDPHCIRIPRWWLVSSTVEGESYPSTGSSGGACGLGRSRWAVQPAEAEGSPAQGAASDIGWECDFSLWIQSLSQKVLNPLIILKHFLRRYLNPQGFLTLWHIVETGTTIGKSMLNWSSINLAQSYFEQITFIK